MQLNDLYHLYAERIVAYRQKIGLSPLSFDDIGVCTAHMFSHALLIEGFLTDDDPRKYTKAVANLAAEALGLLEYLDIDWTLRTPTHEIGRYMTPADLTLPLRKRIDSVLSYWSRGSTRDVSIALELVVKSCLELASKLEFDLGIALDQHLGPEWRRF